MLHHMRLRRWHVAAAILFGTLIGTLTVEAGEPLPTGPWKVSARKAKKKNPVPSDAASLEKGKLLYERECVSCHGSKGKGDGPAVKDLEKKPGDLSGDQLSGQSDGELFTKVTEGRAPMPSLETKLTEDERWHVINYVRSLAPKPSP